MSENGSGVKVRTVAGFGEQLCQLIASRELMPGEQIRQEERARQLGVGRVPLREALQVLASEGLLNHRHDQGYFVAKMSAEDLDQANRMLDFLETALIRTSAGQPTTPADLRELGLDFAPVAAVADRVAMTRTKSCTGASEICRAVGHRPRRGAPLLDALEPYRLLHTATSDAAVAVAEHEEIFDAISARDRALCLRTTAAGHRRANEVAVWNLRHGDDVATRPLATG